MSEKRPTQAQKAQQEIKSAQEAFTQSLPRMDNVLSFRFRHLKGERKDEAMEEARAIAWANWLQLVRDGRDPVPLAGKVAQFAAQGVNSGNKLTGYDPINDVMSWRARAKHGHRVRPVSAPDDTQPDLSLPDHRERDPADVVEARMDAAVLRERLTDEQKEIADDLASGLNTAEIGRKREVSRARIWQHRQEMAAQGAGR